MGTQAKARLASFARSCWVDNIACSMAYYERLGVTFGESWEGFYAIGERDGFELHLKEAPRRDEERQHRRE